MSYQTHTQKIIFKKQKQKNLKNTHIILEIKEHLLNILGC